MNFRVTAQKICNNHFNEIINFGIFAKKFFQTICNQNFSKIFFISMRPIKLSKSLF